MTPMRSVLTLFSMFLVCICAPSIAQDTVTTMVGCQRDLGQGVNLRMTPSYNKSGSLVSATFLFQYRDGDLVLSGKDLHIRILPNAVFIKPTKVEIEKSKSDKDLLTKVMRIDIPNGSGIINNADFIFLNSSIVKDKNNLSIKPLRFVTNAPIAKGMPYPPACGYGPSISEKYEDVATRLNSENYSINRTPTNLVGSWMIDPDATAKYFLRTFSSEEINKLMMVAPFMVEAVLDFENQSVFNGSLTNRKATSHSVIAKDGEGRIYFLRDIDGTSSETLTVTILDKKNISASFGKKQFIQYFLWKKVTPDPSKTATEDFQSRMDAWRVAFKNIENGSSTKPK